MADKDQLAILEGGVEFWNAWRAENPEAVIDLREANLAGAELPGANLLNANLQYANLGGADLTGAQLVGASLVGANLNAAQLNNADLGWANLTNATLLSAEIVGADLESAQLANVNLAHIVWDRRRMRGNYHGIRGLDSCYGNAIFRRDAIDQDYLDTLEMHWHGKRMLTWLFRAWGLIDYGRSIGRVFSLATALIVFFGLLYLAFPALIYYPACELAPPSQPCHPGFSAFYFSITTFMTLGPGDVHPKTQLGQIIVAAEVTLGYLSLGLLLSVLADKVARRS